MTDKKEVKPESDTPVVKTIGDQLTGFEMDLMDDLYTLLEKFSKDTGMYIADIKLQHEFKQGVDIPAAVLTNIGIRTGAKGAIVDVIVRRMKEATPKQPGGTEVVDLKK